MIESIEVVIKNNQQINWLDCLTSTKDPIEMIEEKTAVTNATELRLRREARALAAVKSIKAKEPPPPVFVPYMPTLPDQTYTFLGTPNDSPYIGEIVYFMYSAGRIKIGYSGGLRKRQMDLKGAGPFPPVVLLVVNGTEKDEKKFHAKFAADRLHGEWFALSPKLRSFLRYKLCDRGVASLDQAEAEFADYCAAIVAGYKSPPKRKPRATCPHGKPTYQPCDPCARERDLATLDQIKAGTYEAHMRAQLVEFESRMTGNQAGE